MQVTVEEVSKLKRKMSVEIPLQEVQGAYEEVFAQIRANVRVDGFRPGKFPRQLAEKRFKELMAQEAIQNLVPKYFDQALKEKDLRPATQPHFHNLDVDKQKPLRFDVEFEIVPPFELLPVSTFKLQEKPVDVPAQDVEARIEALRRGRATLEDKGAAPAAANDVVTLDFAGTLDGKTFEGGSGQGQRIELGSGQYLPAFEDGVLGVAAGQEKTFSVTFPADYGAAELQGKTVQFHVKAQTVERRVPPEMNAEFFKQFGGAADEAGFRAHIGKQLREEKERANLGELVQDLARQMRAQYAFDVPEEAVSAALEQFAHDLGHREPEVAADPAQLAARKEQARADILGDLRLSFVVDEVARREALDVDAESVRQRFYMQAYMLGRNPADLIKTDMGERLVGRIQRNLLTDKVLTYLAYKILGKPWTETSAPAAPHDPEQDHEHGHEHSH
jgi:trigger factor